MAMSVNALSIGETNKYFYTPEVRALLESHLEFLKNHSTTTYFEVPPAIAYKYEGDFYGLLTLLKVPIVYQWIVMRMNGFDNPFDADGSRKAFMQPNFGLIERIINTHRTAANSL